MVRFPSYMYNRYADKCISVMPERMPGFSNRFLELSSTETNFVASSSVLIGGQRRRVTSIMLYKASWMKRNYLEPMQNITSKLFQTTSNLTWQPFSKTLKSYQYNHNLFIILDLSDSEPLFTNSKAELNIYLVLLCIYFHVLYVHHGSCLTKLH